MHARSTTLRAFVSCVVLALPLWLSAQASISRNPQAMGEANAAFHAGYAAQQAGNLELARAQFAKATQLAPQIPEGHEALGTVLLELGKPDEAVAEFQAAAKLKPGDAGIETDLAVALAQAGRAAIAIPHFKAVLQRSKEPGQAPVSGAFYESYARALAAAGEPEQAMDQLAAAEALTGPSAELDDGIGSLYAQMGEWNQARSRFAAAIALNGKYVQARVHLGILLRQRHDIEGSLAEFESAFQMEPSNAEVLLEYGRTLAAAGKDGDAAEKLSEAVKANPELPGVQLELAMTSSGSADNKRRFPGFSEPSIAIPVT